MIAEEAKKELESVMKECDLKLNEVKKKRREYEAVGNKLHDFYNCQLNKLNMTYDNAIKIINEKRRLFTGVLNQWIADEERQISTAKTKVKGKIDRLQSVAKDLKHLFGRLNLLKYEELHKAMQEKRDELNSAISEPVASPQDLVYAYFKDSVKLNDLGSVQYLKGNDLKRSPSHRPTHTNPLKEILENKENISRAFDTTAQKIHKKKTMQEESGVIGGGAEIPRGDYTKANEENLQPSRFFYPQTSRGKSSYFGVTECRAGHYKATGKRRKAKISTKTHALSKASELAISGCASTSRYATNRNALAELRKEQESSLKKKLRGDRTAEVVDLRSANNVSAANSRACRYKEAAKRPISSSCRRAYMSKYSSDNARFMISQQKQAKGNLVRFQVSEKTDSGPHISKRKHVRNTITIRQIAKGQHLYSLSHCLTYLHPFSPTS